MQKVAYSVFRTGKNEVKWTGVGWIDGKDLIFFPTTREGKRYRKVLQDVVSYCHQKPTDPTQYTGDFYELVEAEIKTKNGSYDTRIIEVNYFVWFKKI